MIRTGKPVVCKAIEGEEGRRFAAFKLEPLGFRTAWFRGWLLASRAGKVFYVANHPASYRLYPAIERDGERVMDAKTFTLVVK